ncbi:Na+/H+ antiporter subunit G [Neptunomonas phycophila]|jgi:multicomponent K+:H+ antiporter subunit G|uniref:Na+/H+ antiporter subunit G n=1 Tax=Neptunomonas phycophila TaxID=1572645 RepID=A0AAW7XPR7_9GAMM|nr:MULTISPECIES: Na+/H+ antiporter subunit G [Neptunomonas]MBT3144510.1 Na+/H+ antiporter subunit G [Neptunomonas phycophila]MDN2660656.1 Na+/H+ antiporter subunit G [Neptunomonas sp. CHC150]MDO6454987.1 Na+/H+ antiporter subunit G [Neptunomonas phycophila]MDO6468086.1 Na+/H+ antiporter subunit G [Neptunomonas phycophila]MDO6784141.1 Na+/H+ antiporter subunit G [Neptunomonas phycophila]
MPFWVELIGSILILLGGFFVLMGSIGLVKMPDFYMRLHTPTKATTLGMGAILIASMILVSVNQNGLSAHELLISIFLFITAPVTAMMMAKTGLHYHLKIHKGTLNRDLADIAKQRQPPNH